MTHLCSLSLAKAGGWGGVGWGGVGWGGVGWGGGNEIMFQVGVCNLSLYWNGNPLVSAAG
jgi:hypothetical protein